MTLPIHPFLAFHWQTNTSCEIFSKILIAILLPPVGVCFRHGCCNITHLSLALQLVSSCHPNRSCCLINWLVYVFLVGWVLCLFAPHSTWLHSRINLGSLCDHHVQQWRSRWLLLALSQYLVPLSTLSFWMFNLKRLIIYWIHFLCLNIHDWLGILPFCFWLSI